MISTINANSAYALGEEVQPAVLSDERTSGSKCMKSRHRVTSLVAVWLLKSPQRWTHGVTDQLSELF